MNNNTIELLVLKIRSASTHAEAIQQTKKILQFTDDKKTKKVLRQKC